MDPLQALMDDHRFIENVMDGISEYAERLLEDGAPDQQDLSRFVQLLQEYLYGYHHEREEGILFALLTDFGFSAEEGPIGAMMSEHSAGEAMLKTLADFAGMTEPWTKDDKDRIRETVMQFVDLKCTHIQKEDRGFFPMAEGRLGKSALGELREFFEVFEAKEKGKDRLESLSKLAEELTERYRAPVSVENETEPVSGEDSGDL